MLDCPTSSPKITRMFGFAVFGCWARAEVRASGERLVATSAAAIKVRSKVFGFGLTSSLIRFSPFTVFVVELSRSTAFSFVSHRATRYGETGWIACAVASCWWLFAPFVRCCWTENASETGVAGRGIHRFGMARGRAVAAAVVWCAKMRAALQNLARNADVRLTWIKTCCFGAAARIEWDAARLRRISFMLLRPPVAGPLPDVADHVVQAVAVGRKGRHRRGVF